METSLDKRTVKAETCQRSSWVIRGRQINRDEVTRFELAVTACARAGSDFTCHRKMISQNKQNIKMRNVQHNVFFFLSTHFGYYI